MIAYCIDLDAKNPRVLIYSGDALKNDMAYLKAKKPTDISNFNRRVFDTKDQAENFLSLYNHTLKNLDNKKICKDRTLPSIRLFRRWLILTILGVKCYTIRKEKKKWQSGQLFNFHDQTFFVTVKLKSIVDLYDGSYRYNFELV